MNNLERRQIIKARIIDVAVAKAAINQSRRERLDASKTLRKAMAAKQFEASRADGSLYSQAV